nr:MAG TPA: repressor protein [Caudoviricetes sp.]
MIFMYNLQVNIDRISALAKSKGLSINQMLKNAELSTTILDNMKRGRLPSVDKIQSIAEYFDCSVDYLLGRTDNPKVNK